ncbi:protein kinase domain-containing protein [Streptomyces sp. URMC 126]|uniref:serine/threonine-protein kinase n=1 Tax=Streptomyces sp. URMC 126 TaxID=3423401 RepID=UPI003F1A14DE
MGTEPGGPGRVVAGRFSLVERLGDGGMGTVWRAHDPELRRDVALKEVRLPGGPGPDAAGGGDVAAVRERVLREARALARLRHPNVVTIHEIVPDDPFPWLVMELVEGVTLQRMLDDGGPLDPVRAARVGADVLSALRAAHAAGVRHRDVKAANVIVRPDGSAVLTDFGIAALEDAPGLTLAGGVVGSPEYMAPERAAGEPGGPAADLWSLGMLLYLAVEGRNPLRRDTPLATLAAVRETPPPPPLRAGVLTPVLTALLVRDPAARPDAAELARMLDAAARGLPHGAGPGPHHAPTVVDGPVPPADGRARRRRVTRAAGVAALCVLVGVAGTLVGLRLTDDDGGGGRAAAPLPPGATVSAQGTRPPSAAPSSPAPAPSDLRSDPPAAPPDSTRAPAPPSSGPEGEPGTWIAQLASVPLADGPGARDRELAAVRRQIPDARVLRSDDYASLRPGYWVVYAPGPFSGGTAALTFCEEAGRLTDDTCVGRYLSHRAADRNRICKHEGSCS